MRGLVPPARGRFAAASGWPRKAFCPGAEPPEPPRSTVAVEGFPWPVAAWGLRLVVAVEGFSWPVAAWVRTDGGRGRASASGACKGSMTGGCRSRASVVRRREPSQQPRAAPATATYPATASRPSNRELPQQPRAAPAPSRANPAQRTWVEEAPQSSSCPPPDVEVAKRPPLSRRVAVSSVSQIGLHGFNRLPVLSFR